MSENGLVFDTPATIGAIIANIHGKADFGKRDLTASRSSAFDGDQVSATINDALAKAGFDADEAESLLAGYHVAVDQFDDDEDESRKLLSDVLLKVLEQPDVEKVDGALDVLGDKADGLVPRNVDTTAGPNDGKKAGRVVVIDPSHDLAPRDRDSSVATIPELMATLTLAEGHSGKGPIPGFVPDGRDEHGGKHDNISSQLEKRQEATGNAGPEPLDSPKSVDEEHLRPTPTESLVSSHPLLAQFKEMGLLDNLDEPRAATAEEVGRILHLPTHPNSTKLPGSDPSLTDNDNAKLNFFERLKEMGLVKKPTGKRVITTGEIFERLQDYMAKANIDRNSTLSTADDPAKYHERIPIPVGLISHSKRSVPEVVGCDCQATIDAIKEDKPEGGMTYTWFQGWKHKDVNTLCVRPCVDKAIEHFAETVKKYQLFEEQFGLKNPPGLAKRKQPLGIHGPVEGEVPTVKNEPPKSAFDGTYRDWVSKTQKTGEFCTCDTKSSWLWSWVKQIYGTSSRCINFCSQSVKPFLEKEKEKQNLAVPKEPSANVPVGKDKERVEGSLPSGENAPGVVSVPISQGLAAKTQPEKDAPDTVEDKK